MSTKTTCVRLLFVKLMQKKNNNKFGDHQKNLFMSFETKNL